MPELDIKPLTPDLAADYFAFFDRPAFADNPQWAGCYCRCYHVDPARETRDDTDAEGNRADVARRIAEGHMAGYLAYAGAEVVGWLNAGPSRYYPAANVGGPDPDAERMAHIVCFVVAPAWRGKGVARTLLEAALADAKARGLALVQAAPRLAAEGGAANYHGPLSMFEKAGFTRHRAEGRTLFVRRALG